MENFDVAVVGLGALGSAAAYYAALKGAKVIALEQFEFGNVHGASHDTSRIVRTSYNTPEYVALAKAAYKDWAHIEEAAGYKLLHISGGVTFFGKQSSLNSSDYARSLDANDVPYELLTPIEVGKRWPQFNTDNVVDAIYTPDTGIVHAARSVATMQSLARAHGAVLKEHTKVERIQPEGPHNGVRINTSKGQFLANKVILAADAWTNKLLEPLGLNVPLVISQEQVTYYKPSSTADFEPTNFPVWIHFDKKSFYGFPTFGEPTIKCARDESQHFMTPEERDYVHSPELLDELTGFIDGMIPDAARKTLRTVTCQYTVTQDRNFIISPLKKHGNIFVALGAAHGFKFAPAIGRVLAELAIDGKTSEDISQWTFPEANKMSKL
ncbi:hypothetical protein COCC4DRAFT_134420 [Bipolaris maydis ATCC 48331]|uniref:FAD dependent oxidoreductase domain-containing protein n=2 Tax=Cochliobolus heterostrophus TaxID=5016 RepID=M2TZP7_COCH5|nr:uncharacterized protein COCC4DRAFT_134420 [Bipolaris maydis ATCC 48331]EMD87301.1 hypothetical protein COCHEDRAFT_1112961 [Bipolaris maydis C5]KAH7554713.1 hypothetical protein BM1_07374 [Bipolaris maydis]ENI06500.1 hypothetical protein COCC4DRAFT_134420 [Bipolaris maydis ATCC 48331]KAJ5023400.1 FAD dependent oxidoreductase [Bipolaris maydis]KAJ6193603.1 FAD dependent oxidoreductase [Bipolaris maydis]